jgi:hypothetical protein
LLRPSKGCARRAHAIAVGLNASGHSHVEWARRMGGVSSAQDDDTHPGVSEGAQSTAAHFIRPRFRLRMPKFKRSGQAASPPADLRGQCQRNTDRRQRHDASQHVQEHRLARRKAPAVVARSVERAGFEPVSTETQPVSGRSRSQISDIEKSSSRDSARDSRPLAENAQYS